VIWRADKNGKIVILNYDNHNAIMIKELQQFDKMDVPVDDHRHSGRIRSTESKTQCFSRNNANTNDEPEISDHFISHLQVSHISKIK